MSTADPAVTSPAEPLVLISYAHVDGNRALDLAHELKKEDIEVWIDTVDIRAGKYFPDRIEEGIDRCTHVVVVLTEAARRSKWVKKEISYALSSGKEPIPAILETCKIPLTLAGTHYADFRLSPEEGLRELLHAIRYGGERTLPELPWYWRLFWRHKALVAGVFAVLLTLFVIAFIPPSSTSATLTSEKRKDKSEVLRLHLDNRGPWPSTVLGGYRLKFGDLPIVDENLNVDPEHPPASLVVPRRSSIDIFLVKRSGFDTKGGLTAAQIQPLLRDHTITLEVTVKESDDRSYVRPATVKARDIWSFLNANLPHIFMGAAHAA